MERQKIRPDRGGRPAIKGFKGSGFPACGVEARRAEPQTPEPLLTFLLAILFANHYYARINGWCEPGPMSTRDGQHQV
jgi:hypothetical protein